MTTPSKLILPTEADYRAHFERTYCMGSISTFDFIKVRFKKSDFDHCMFESSQRNKIKDTFSHERAQRINWIKATLENPLADLYIGWDGEKKIYAPDRRVAVVYEDFTVIISVVNLLEKHAKFITAFPANNSLRKIIKSPKWK